MAKVIITASNEERIKKDVHSLTHEDATIKDVKIFRAGYKRALKDVCELLKDNKGETPERLRTLFNNIRNGIKL